MTEETRLALCDMTNLPSKRGISSILGDFLLKSGDDSTGKVVAREGSSGVKFSKRLCLVVDDLVKESTRTSDNTNDASSSDDKNSFGCSPVDDVGYSENFDVKESQGETNAVDIIGVRHPKSEDDGGQRECEKDSNVTVFSSQTDVITREDLPLNVFSSSNSENDDKLAMVGTEGAGMLANSQTVKSFNMKRCSSGDSVGIVKHEVEAHEELKSCNCSFCLKAAYIWSDLHYQDIKGRLSVLKKSQKEASSLIQRNVKAKSSVTHGSVNSNNSTNVESDHMGQWTSLFLNMESILARESSHLQNSFVAMKELRENCKIDLERATKTPQNDNT